MYKPVLSIDVSKSKSCAAAFLSYGEPYLKPFTFNHSQKGTMLLTKKLNDLESKTGIKPEVVLGLLVIFLNLFPLSLKMQDSK